MMSAAMSGFSKAPAHSTSRGYPASNASTTTPTSPIGKDHGAVGGEVMLNAEDEESIQVLERHRLFCEKEGNYGDAEALRLRTKGLIDGEQQRRREELNGQQLNERMGVEEAHIRELEAFNGTWDQKVREFEEHASNLQDTLGRRAKLENGSYMEKLRTETEPRTPRFSVNLLQLRKIQMTLGKQKKYPEAQDVKAQADKVEDKEVNQWRTRREAKLAALEEQYLQKQQLEMCGLLKRIQSGRDEQTQARKIELNRILQRYLNVKKQLDSQQRNIVQRLEKFTVGAADLNCPQPKTVMSSKQTSPRALGA